MLALAPFVVQRPALLVVDEPSLGLAPMIVEQVTGMLRELRDGGTAVLVVEEKASHLLDVADTIALFELGRITWSGAPAELGADQLADAYLARQS
jgi:branched-chain amino acid transport system ATP-binding protein